MEKAFIFLFTLLFCGCATSLPTDDGPDLYTVQTSFRDTVKTRTGVYVSVPFEELVFERTAEPFRRAEWDVEAVVSREDKVIIALQGHQIETVPDASREDESGKLVSTYFFDFNGTPGQYKMKVIVTDRSSGKSQKRDCNLTLRKIEKNSFDISDPVFFGEAVRGNDRTKAFLDEKKLNHRKPLEFFFEFYAPDSVKTADLVARYHILREGEPKTVYEYADTLSAVGLENGNRQISITRTLPDDLGSEDYVFEFYVEVPGYQTITHIVRKEIAFSGDWPNSSAEMKMAFGALRYLSEKAAAAIKEAPNKREKVAIFYRSLTTDEYSLPSYHVDLKEFMLRLNYANSAYSSPFSKRKNDGWQTARGRIYLKYGLPDTFFNYPASTFRLYPYEVWYYSARPASRGKDRIFVFVNKYGEEYRLDHYPKYLPELGRYNVSDLNNEN